MSRPGPQGSVIEDTGIAQSNDQGGGAASVFSPGKKLQRNVSAQAPTVLIYRIGQLGDTLVAMPAIHAIRQNYPRHRLALLTDRHTGSNGYVSSWDVLCPTGWFDEVLFFYAG